MPLPKALASWLPRLAVNAAYRSVFDSPEGVRVLRDLMLKAGLLESAAVAGDPFMTHWRDGRRSMVCEILAELRWSESDIARLARERAEGGGPPMQDEDDAEAA